MRTTPYPQDSVVRTSLACIAIVLVLGALKLGSEIFAPLFMAIVGGIIVAPIMDWLDRAHVPRTVGALLIPASGVIIIATLAFFAEPLIWRIVEELPKIRVEVRMWIDEFRGLINGLDEVNKQVEQALGTENSGKASTEEAAAAAAAVPSLTEALFVAPRVIAQILIFLGTLFFFLLTRRNIYAWISNRIGGPEDTELISQRFKNAETLVSRYFLTITSINVVLGIALAGALTAIGLPWPLIWGVVATLLNFVLYLGPAVLVVCLTIAGLIAFHGLLSFAPPLIFLLLNMLESQFVTPALIGKNISLNPLLVFVSLVFWLWLWGPVGGIIAIPVMLIVIALLDIIRAEDIGHTGEELAEENSA